MDTQLRAERAADQHYRPQTSEALKHSYLLRGGTEINKCVNMLGRLVGETAGAVWFFCDDAIYHALTGRL